VSGGVLHLNLKPGHGNAPYPIPSTGWNGLYREYSVRFQSDNVAGYHAAWLEWPSNNVWPGNGEIDFPEANLPNNIYAFMHWQGGTSGSSQNAYGTSTVFGNGAWHTATTIWKPGDLTFILDGVVIGHATGSLVPNTPMHQVLQTEIACSGAATQNADVRIAWAVVYDYVPGTPPS
jgi:beta-glucanase (GH16 family)